MANREHLEILKKGVGVWNRWRKENPTVTPDLIEADPGEAGLLGVNLHGAKLLRSNLREANLAGADLSGAELSGVDLCGANLSAADLFSANLLGANLRNANLSGAKLRVAYMVGADLCRANLTGADLTGTDLGGVDLEEADLSHALMGYTSLGRVDLSTVRGLETVRHDGPSSIGIDTIYSSKAMIPEVFLRGAGIPENFIEYMRSLVANPIEYYSCFISYSCKDEEFAQRLYNDLQANGVRCWFAPHDMQGGRKLHEQIDQAIRIHERVLLILSPDSMHSEWVKTEIAKARKREVEQKKQVLFPLRLVSFEAIRDWECFDADAGKDSAQEIREYFIPDFSNWENHDEYEKAFGRLMSDLRARDEADGRMPA